MGDGSAGGDERYGYSPVTDQWYLVTDWIDLGDGEMQAESKVPVERDEVPEEWLGAVDERPDGEGAGDRE